MKRPRRTILKVAVLLIAGAMLNVAVAWGCAIAPQERVGNAMWREGPTTEWAMLRFEFIGLMQLRWRPIPPDMSWKTIGMSELPRWSVFDQRALAGPSHELQGADFRVEEASGLPLLSMRYLGYWDPRALTLSIESGWFFSRPNRPSPFESKVIPLGIIPSAFAINTLFYAGVLWVLFAGPFALRRMIRRRRGQCPACAYPIGQNPVCTECGTAVTAKVVQG